MNDKQKKGRKGSGAVNDKRKNKSKKNQNASSDLAIAEEILDLHISVGPHGNSWTGTRADASEDSTVHGDRDQGSSGGDRGAERPNGDPEAGDAPEAEGGQSAQGAEQAEAPVRLSLRTYVKQRQEGSASRGEAMSDERKAEELRETALLGPFLNGGER